MPKRNSKKVVKLSKMTEEERILYLEQKALAEEEMRKKKEEILMMFLKDKLVKEEKISHLNVLKINKQWRNILREVKSQELKEELDILSQTFERVVDRKNNVIKALATDADEADEQYNMALRSHLHNVDQLVDHHRRRVISIQEDYQHNLHMVRTDFEHERELITDCHSHEIEKLRHVMYAMEQNNIESEAEAKQEFHNFRDEVKNQNLEERHMLRIQLESTVELLWKQFQNALKNYNEQTTERRAAFEALRDKDEKSAKEIEAQMARLHQIHEKMSHLRAKILQNTKECETRNRDVREQKEVVQMRYQWLKAELNQLRVMERERLTSLTVQSNAAIKKLKQILSKGIRVLRLAELCRKLETEEEKVLPFYRSSLNEDEEENAEICQFLSETTEWRKEAAFLEKPTEPLAALIHDYSPLENFWKRYNKVLLDEFALQKEKSVLTEENLALRDLLKQYLNSISVTEEVMKENNTLLVVNQRTNVQFPLPVTDPRAARGGYNVIELKHAAKYLLE